MRQNDIVSTELKQPLCAERNRLVRPLEETQAGTRPDTSFKYSESICLRRRGLHTAEGEDSRDLGDRTWPRRREDVEELVVRDEHLEEALGETADRRRAFDTEFAGREGHGSEGDEVNRKSLGSR